MKPIVKSIKNDAGERITEGDEFNLTHLSPAKEVARLRFVHRDFVSTCFRYVFAANYIFKHYRKDTCNVLDVGIAPDWNQLMAIHSNGVHPAKYVGVDARDCSRTILKVPFNASFQQMNIVDGLPSNDPNGWQVVICMEVIEHLSKDNGIKLLANLHSVMDENSILLFSTPCYDEEAGQATNHIHEWKYLQLKEELEKTFEIVDHFGVFASQKDYKPFMSETELAIFNRLKEYYNSAMISCIFAPLYPDKARNCLWILKKKI